MWIISNAAAPFFHWKPVDAPPFAYLQDACSLGSLVIALVVLITQNRQGRVDERRAQFDLQISLLNEQKLTKIISLLEELRRDMPSVRDRHDPEVDRLTQAVDPKAMIDALEVRILANEMLAEEEAAAEEVD